MWKEWTSKWQYHVINSCECVLICKLAFVVGNPNEKSNNKWTSGSNNDNCCTFSNLFTQPKTDKMIGVRVCVYRVECVGRAVSCIHYMLFRCSHSHSKLCVCASIFHHTWVGLWFLQWAIFASYKWAAKLREMIIKWCVDKYILPVCSHTFRQLIR